MRAAVVGLGLLECLLAVGCAAPPRGLQAARAELLDGDLVAALVLLDEVPPADREYPEARSTAVAIERRLAVGQRLFARGLELRAQWRDDEAIDALCAAQVVWPDVPGVSSLIVATGRRAQALESLAGETDAELEVATTVPVLVEIGAVPGGAASADIPDVVEAGGSAASSVADDLLSAARAALAAGEVDAALDHLESLPAAARRQPEVLALLVEVLHQRALLHYGAGELATSIAVWRRLLLLDPGHALGRAFFDAAMVEVESRPVQG